MKSILIIFVILFSVNYTLSQVQKKPSALEISTLPTWAQEMYSQNPNVLKVDKLYSDYFKTNSFEKSYHTQYYKRWRRENLNYINSMGYIQKPSQSELHSIQQIYLSKTKNSQKTNSSSWSSAGPVKVYKNNGIPGDGQSNIYSIDQCLSSLNTVYCGTEPGEVYKSIDMGLNWTCVSMNENFGSGVTAIEVNPFDENIVFAGGNDGVFRSQNGATTWSKVLPINAQVNEFFINPDNTQLVFACTDAGLYKSLDGGINWNLIFPEKTYDIKAKPQNNSTMYIVKNNPTLNICEFYSTSDNGLTWNLQSNGWYSSTDAGRNDGGARLGVTPADPNVVYAYLIGEAKANDYGFIGVYRSDDSGNSWDLPNGPAGGPYTTFHKNLAIGGNGWNYHQGFYNCAILVDENDPDKILVGGLNLYRSIDGAIFYIS